MAEPVALISSERITQQDFATALTAIGAVIDPSDAAKARFSSGDMHVWLFRRDEELSTFERPVMELITRGLGGAPQTCIIIEISRRPGSESLALEVACAFASRWPCVVYDLGREVYTKQELAVLRQSGKGFSE
jgi:hypothetical protein